MEELNINVASSYLVMAAELMEIKSKSLLPVKKEETNNEEDEEKIYAKMVIALFKSLFKESQAAIKAKNN